MGTLIQYVGATLSYPKRLKLQLFASRARCSAEVGVSTRQLLQQLEKELAKGDDRAALALVKDLQGKPGGLRCFGAARQILAMRYPRWLVLSGIILAIQRILDHHELFILRTSEREFIRLLHEGYPVVVAFTIR
ncbi:hypothetical protein K1719_033845 [Acacia pycnantha]|nr:hypothetical protein K1719_033845 [Acacia pycnantha]